MKKRILITMSGGTTTVINATLAGLLDAARDSRAVGKVFAGVPGILGVMKGEIQELPKTTRVTKALKNTPCSGFIGATRVKPLSKTDHHKFFGKLTEHKIDYFINIGGNGTIQQSRAIAAVAPSDLSVVSLPKTVDNDMGDKNFEDVWYTPGFPSCARYWRHKTTIMNQENLGAGSHDQVLIAQTFGRETGFLAGCARLADQKKRWPLLIFLPEDQQDKRVLLKKIRQMLKKYNRLMIVMSEGYKIGDIGGREDPSGQVMYGSSQTTNAQLLVNYLHENKIQARAIIPGPDQRGEFLLRSKQDVNKAYKLGRYAVKQLLDGKKNFLASISKRKNGKSRLLSIPYNNCDNYSRVMKPEWIDYGNFDVSNSYLNYLNQMLEPEKYKNIQALGKPLITGKAFF